MINNPINKINHTLRFVVGELEGVPEDFQLDIVDKQNSFVLVTIDGEHELEIPIQDVMLDRSDYHYYSKVKEFVKGLVCKE